MKTNNGYAKLVIKYDVDNYLLDINNKRLHELLSDESNDAKQALYLLMDFYIQKQYDQIPTKFKIPTILYTRLDLDLKKVIEYNYNRTDIAAMKKIFSENDAMQNSMVWNFARVQYDVKLKENNNNDLLKIKYLIRGWEDYQDIVDQITLYFYNKFIK